VVFYVDGAAKIGHFLKVYKTKQNKNGVEHKVRNSEKGFKDRQIFKINNEIVFSRIALRGCLWKQNGGLRW
jgi:hypothetical protein